MVEVGQVYKMPSPVRPLGLSRLSISDFEDIMASVKERLVRILSFDNERNACDDQKNMKRDIRLNVKAELLERPGRASAKV